MNRRSFVSLFAALPLGLLPFRRKSTAKRVVNLKINNAATGEPLTGLAVTQADGHPIGTAITSSDSGRRFTMVIGNGWATGVTAAKVDIAAIQKSLAQLPPLRYVTWSLSKPDRMFP